MVEKSVSISGSTHMVCLLGKPTHHSLSPATHNLSFAQAGIDAVYLCFDIENDNLPEALATMRALDTWDGANLTMPAKQAVVPLLDELDEAAQLMGAVNVVSCRNGILKGYNTDGVGFMENVRKHGVKDKGAHMVLIGCGGAGSAILVQAALDGVSTIDVFVRLGGGSEDNARRLANPLHDRTGCSIAIHSLADVQTLQSCVAQADILVNSSSVGMGEASTETPVPADFLQSGMAVADVVYFPRETQLLKDARVCGCTTIGGLGMLIEQAAAGEKIWYGIEMDTNLIERELYR